MDCVTPVKNTVISLKPIRVGRRDAASFLGLCERSVDYLVSQKRLHAKRDGKKVFFLVADLERYAASDHTLPIRSTAA